MSERKRITDAFDAIEPRAGAKERMLQNIRAKAEGQAKEPVVIEQPEAAKKAQKPEKDDLQRRRRMERFFSRAAVAAAVLLIICAGLKASDLRRRGAKKPTPDDTGIKTEGPITGTQKYEDREAIIKDFREVPEPPEGATDVCYYREETLGTYAVMQFVYDGYLYKVYILVPRANGDGTFYKTELNLSAKQSWGWYKNDAQCILATDDEVSKEEFERVYEMLH